MYTSISLVSTYSCAFALNAIQGRGIPVLPQTKRKNQQDGGALGTKKKHGRQAHTKLGVSRSLELQAWLWTHNWRPCLRNDVQQAHGISTMREASGGSSTPRTPAYSCQSGSAGISNSTHE